MHDDNPWKPPTAANDVPDGGADDVSGSPAEPANVNPWAPAGSASTVPPADSSPSLPPVPSPPPAPVAPPMPGAAPAAPPTSVDTLTLSSDPGAGRSRRSRLLVGGAVTAVLAVGAAGVFAVSNFTGAPQGGAESPSELGLTLLQAIEDEDVLGVVDVLVPGERDVFRDPLVDLVSELTRLDVLSDAADLSRVLGIDVELTGEDVSAAPTNVPDIVNIDLHADAVVTLDGAELPIGSLITDNLPGDLLTELRGTRVTETDEFDVRLTAVEQDDRWYFSVFHSIAELARSEVAPGTLIPIEGIGSNGEDSPSAAFDGLLDRVEALDVAGMIRTLDPGEAAALQRYAPLFLDDVEPLIAEAPFEWSITRREFHIDESGDRATVFLDAIAIEGTAEGETFSLEFADGCVRIDAVDEHFEQCNDDAATELTDLFDDSPAVERLLDTITEAFSDLEATGLEMHRTDGAWYLSPTATVTEAFLALLRALDRSELDAIIELAPAAAEEFTDELFGDMFGYSGDMFDDYADEYSDDAGADSGDDYADYEYSDEYGGSDDSSGSAMEETVDSGDMVVVEPSADDPTVLFDECYAEEDPDLAAACFQSFVASGQLELWLMPVELRFPECGYTGAWRGGHYQLPDAEFIAAAEAARPCFLDLVEQGVVAEYELPAEISSLECFEGRNWYTVYDDPDYDDRYFACLAEQIDE